MGPAMTGPAIGDKLIIMDTCATVRAQVEGIGFMQLYVNGCPVVEVLEVREPYLICKMQQEGGAPHEWVRLWIDPSTVRMGPA